MTRPSTAGNNSEDGDADAENSAHVDLQESLGVTPEGNCKRHPHCPVLSIAHNKIMSCRVCFSEEKSVGIRQRKSFAAVVEQLQKTADSKQLEAQESAEAESDAGRRKVQRAHSASMQALIVQQPQIMDSIMKRMAQVQNWTMRQKDKEVMSLKLQIQSLEEKLHHAEVLNQENKQTIWALRRTIQQDMRLIKTMADQKEQSFARHESPMNSSPQSRGYLSDSPSLMSHPGKTLLSSPEKAGNRLGSSGNSVSHTPLASPAGKYCMPGPNTPDPDDTTTTEGGNETPEAMRGILVNNPEESDPLLDKVRQMKKALQSKFQELRAPDSNNRNSKNTASAAVPRPPNSMMQPRDAPDRMEVKSASAHVPGRPHKLSTNMRELRPLVALRRLSADGLSTHTSRSLDEMVEPLPEQKQSDIVLEPQDVRTPYWNDVEYASMSADPSKIFSSFRGGLLDIPKSPPAASHDNRQRDRPKLHMDPNQMSALKVPRMRGVGRTLSYQSDDGFSLDGMSVGDSQSVASYAFSVTSQSIGSYSEAYSTYSENQYDQIPVHSLASNRESLKPRTPEQTFDNTQKFNGDQDDKSVSSNVSYEQPPPPPLHHTSAGPPPKHNARKPKRTVSTDEILDVVPEVNEDEDLYGSRSNFNFTAAPTAPAPSKPIPPPPMTSPPIKRPPYANRMQDDERTRGDETVDTTPSFFTESGAFAALSDELEKQQEKERFLFTVTGAECQDKYGDTGIYTGTILVTEALPHGKGCMKYQSGRVYEGDWVSGQWHGNGKLLNANGDTYEGEFVLDARHGKGEYKWDNGDIYTGDFAYDRRNGNGKFLFHNGNVYEGEFVDGMFEGFGRYEFDDGYYEGEWRQGRYHGDGELQYANGGKYTGEFRESLAHGFGVETLPDGTKRRGVWERGEPVEFFHRSSEALPLMG